MLPLRFELLLLLLLRILQWHLSAARHSTALSRLYPCAIVVLAGHLDLLEQFIDFRAGFFVVMFRHLLGHLVEFVY